MTPEEIRKEQKIREKEEMNRILFVKRKLNYYRYSLRMLKKAKEEKKSMIYSMLNCKAIKYDDMPHGSRIARDISDQMIRLKEINKLIEFREHSVRRAYRKVERLIATLEDPLEKKLLIEQYLYLRKWTDISKNNHISKKTISKISKRAISKLGKL